MVVPLLLAAGACNRDPKVQAQRYLENGNKFFEKEKYKEASIMYKRALAKDPLFGDAYYRLALADLKLGAYQHAYQMLVRAADLLPENLDAAVKLADIELLASTQDTRARKTLLDDAAMRAQTLLAKDPDSYDGHRILGQIALLEERPADAIPELALANRAKPNEPPVVLAYFQALAGADRFAEAEQAARQLIAAHKEYSPIYDALYVQYRVRNRPADAEAVLKEKIANNPENGSFVLQLAAHQFLTSQREAMDRTIATLEDDKKYPNGRLLAGDFYFLRLREFELARLQYEAGIRAFPADKLIYQKRLVELLANKGDSRAANSLLAEILKDHPDDTDANAMRAALRLATGSRDEINLAANEFQSLVTKNPTNHLLRYNLAKALLAKNEREQARLQLEEAIKLRTDFIAARELLTRVHLMKGDAGRALQEADAILQLDPKNLTAHLSRSSALLIQNDRQKAREELEYITRNYPQNADARFQVGYLAWQEGDFATATRVFGEIRRANPRDYRGLAGMVETLAGQKRLDEAIQEMQKASAGEPERRDLRVALANLYVRAEQYDRALEIYKAVLDQDPRDAGLLFRMGETYRRKGDLNAAIEMFRRSAQAAPSDAAPLLQLGLLLDGIGRREQAKPVYEQILKIDPGHAVALNNLAYIKAEEGVDLDQALTMAQRARQTQPNSDDIADTLGWVYIKKNLSDDAVRLFTELVRKKPDNPVFRYHYGMALLQKGDRLSAKRELETALRNNPSRNDAAKIQELLRTL
jgi:tetratricopeptide (TPR) repeat protein